MREDSTTVMFAGWTSEIGGTLENIYELFMKLVMFGGRTTEVETALESMWELFMKENWPL